MDCEFHLVYILQEVLDHIKASRALHKLAPKLRRLDFSPKKNLHVVCAFQVRTRQKGLHKQLLSDVVNALASVYCYFLRVDQTGDQQQKSYSGLLLTAFPCRKT